MKYILTLFAGLMLVGCGAQTEPAPTPKMPEPIEKSVEKAPAAVEGEDTKTAAIEAETPEPQALAQTVTLVEYFDFNCGYCNRAADIGQTLRAEYGDELEMKFINFNIYPAGEVAHRGMVCATKEGKGTEFHDLWFGSYYGRNSEANVLKAGVKLGLDETTFEQCLSEESTTDSLAADYAKARTAGARGTPFFMLNGKAIPGLISEDQFRELIDTELAGS